MARLLFDRLRSYAIDPGVAQQLWVVSEEIMPNQNLAEGDINALIAYMKEFPPPPPQQQ